MKIENCKLEIYFDRLFGSLVLQFEEFKCCEVEDIGQNIGGESLNLGIKIAHVCIVEASSGLDLVLCI